MQTVKLKVDNMHCAMCAQGVEKVLFHLGASDIYVDYVTGKAGFKIADNANIQNVIEEIGKIGFSASLGKEAQANDPDLSSINLQFIISLIFTLPLIIAMFVPIPLLHNHIFQLIICIPVFAIGVSYFGKSAIGSLRAGVPNMDALVIIGIVSSFFYSLYGTIIGNEDMIFYETTASITTLILLGNLMEHIAVKKTTVAIESLQKIQPKTAKKVVNQSTRETQEVLVSEINVNDILLINLGDTVPVDGQVVWGEASIDESFVTGESLPIVKNIGDNCISGTTINSGSIKLKAETVGSNTTIAQIIKLVEDAQRQKPKIQKMGDVVAGVFVPVVFCIALATLLISTLVVGIPFGKALLNSIAVLVISCPCAMGLATPTAIMVAIGKLAKQGILVKSGRALETFANAKFLAFDKTGTLTNGDFRIGKIITEEMSEEYVKPIILGLEKHSSHPIAHSIVKHFNKETPYNFDTVQERKGFGVVGTDGVDAFEIGSYKIIAESEKLNNKLLSNDIFVIKNKKIIAAFNLEDSVKENGKEVINKLIEQGLTVLMISGDKKNKCKTVADELGIDQYYYEMNPKEKLDTIETLKEQGILAYVGDGVNDAPALTKADIGISLSSANQIAKDSAQIILLNGDLSHLISLQCMSKATFKTIKQNLFWAFFYNCVAIPVAACGFLTPMVAALTMALSDVMVIGNSLRLNMKKTTL